MDHFDPTSAPNPPLRLICAPITSWTPAHRFDLITCVHGLHYVGDKLTALARAASWLTDDGLLVADLDLASVRLADGRPAGRRLSASLRRAGCDPVPVGCCACMEELLDLTVVGHRPSTRVPGLVDVDVDGRVRMGPRYTPRTLAQPPEAADYRLTGDVDEQLGSCLDVAGVFWQRPEPPGPPGDAARLPA